MGGVQLWQYHARVARRRATSGSVAGGRIALAVADICAASAELRSNGARVVGEPVDYSVCRAVEVLDPDGNTAILHQRADGSELAML